MFEGVENDVGSRKGLYGTREEPGSDFFRAIRKLVSHSRLYFTSSSIGRTTC